MTTKAQGEADCPGTTSQDMAQTPGKDLAIPQPDAHASTHLAIANPAVPPTVLPFAGLTVPIASAPPSKTTRII